MVTRYFGPLSGDKTGAYADPATWGGSGAPQPGDTLVLSPSGIVVAAFTNIDVASFILDFADPNFKNPNQLILQDGSIGPNTTLTDIDSDDGAPSLVTEGFVYNYGTIVDASYAMDININPDVTIPPSRSVSVFNNFGTIDAAGSLLAVYTAARTQLANNGIITTTNQSKLAIDGDGQFVNNWILMNPTGGNLSLNVASTQAGSGQFAVNNGYFWNIAGETDITFSGNSPGTFVNTAFTVNYDRMNFGSGGTIQNTSEIFNGGVTTFNSPVKQAPFGGLYDYGGTMNLQAPVDGGAIFISQAVLELGKPSFIGSDTVVDFNADWGTLKFDGLGDLTAIVRANPSGGNDLLIATAPTAAQPPTIVADLHLVGRAYSTSDFFEVHNQVVFQPGHGAV